MVAAVPWSLCRTIYRPSRAGMSSPYVKICAKC